MTGDGKADGPQIDTLVDCLRGRRSIKLFDDRPVARDELLAAIETARWAPNHHVTEPWHFYLLGDERRSAMVDLVRTVTAESKNREVADRKAERWSQIPAWLVVTCAVADDELTRLEDYAACCCAIQNLSLYLWSVGVGMKWSTGAITRDTRFYELLGIDYERETVIGLMSCGYPRTVPTQRRRPVDEIVTILE